MGSVIKPPNISSFHSTLGFGSLSSLQNSASPPPVMGVSRNHLAPEKHGSQNFKHVNLKFSSGTFTQNFMQGRNSDATFTSSNAKLAVGEQRSLKKFPYQMKLVDKFKNQSIHVDAHNTVISFDRSKSDLGAGKVSSSMIGTVIANPSQVTGAINNSQPMNIFNETLHQSNRNMHFNQTRLAQPGGGQFTIGMNTLGDAPRAPHGAGSSALRNKQNLSPISPRMDAVLTEQLIDSFFSPKAPLQ